MSDFDTLDDLATMLRTSLPLAVKAADEAGTVEGYGAIFGNVDHVGDRIEPGAFTRSLAVHKAAGTSPAFLWSHLAAEPVGSWTEVVEDRRGLFCRGRLNLASERGKQAFAHLRAGDVTGLSIGFRVPKGGYTVGDDGVTHLRQLDLFEISAVSVPANPQARITAVKSLETERDLERLLRDGGLSRSAAKMAATGGWRALNTPTHQPEQLRRFIDRVKAATAELRS